MKTEIKGYFEVNYHWVDSNGHRGTSSLIIKAKDIYESNRKYLEWIKVQERKGMYPSIKDCEVWTHPLQCDID